MKRNGSHFHRAICYNMVMRSKNDYTELITWVEKGMREQRWSLRDLARESGLSHGTISKVLNRRSNPGLQFCEGMARAFKIPVREVLRMAGILEPAELDHNSEVMLGLFRNLPESEQDRVLTIMRALSTMHDTVADDANGSNDTKGE